MTENTHDKSAETAWGWEESVADGLVALSGEIDFTVTPRMRERLAAFIEATGGEIILDMGGLDYIDSSGLAALIEARKILKSKGRKIRISEVSPQVRKLFNLTQIGDLFGL
jgi:anti-sigma B factor antagonist